MKLPFTIFTLFLIAVGCVFVTYRLNELNNEISVKDWQKDSLSVINRSLQFQLQEKSDSIERLFGACYHIDKGEHLVDDKERGKLCQTVLSQMNLIIPESRNWKTEFEDLIMKYKVRRVNNGK